MRNSKVIVVWEHYSKLTCPWCLRTQPGPSADSIESADSGLRNTVLKLDCVSTLQSNQKCKKKGLRASGIGQTRWKSLSNGNNNVAAFRQGLTSVAQTATWERRFETTAMGRRL